MKTISQSVPARAALPHAEKWTLILGTAARSHTRLANAVAAHDSSRKGSTLLRELEDQRARIARDLHAGAGQPLAGIRLNAELLEQWSDSMPGAAKAALARIIALTDAALDQVRSVSHELHPPAWQELSIENALRGLLKASGVELRFQQVHVDIATLSIPPAHDTKVAVYRCAQECISNAIRHSEGSAFSLSLEEAGSWLQLRVSDNGRGMPNRTSPGGLGLRSIRHHAEAAGGDCRILAAEPGNMSPGGCGTAIVIRVPVAM